MMSGKLKIQMTRSRTVRASVVRMYGMVIWKSMRALPAPSSAAASKRSSGTDCRAARIMIAKNVTPYQTFATMTANIAVFGSASHGIGVSISPTFWSRSLITPNSLLNIQRNRMPMRKPEMAHGKKIIAW